MTRQRHYHPLAALRFLRKAVVVCLLPLANALLEFSLNALLTALRQDAALLLFLCGASSILLEASSWALDEAGVLRLRWAFLSKQERIIRGEALAALTIERPLFFRLLGASRVVLYPVGQPAKRAVTLYLHKEDAQELADRLMPVRDPVCHRPAGGERAALVVFGCQRPVHAGADLSGHPAEPAISPHRRAVALSRLNVLVRFAAHWLPAGAAWMLVLTGLLFGISLARSFVQTVHYTGLAHCRPAGQPGRLAVPVRVPGAEQRDKLRGRPRLPHRPAHEALAGVRGGRQLPPGAAAFRLPLRAGRAVPGAAARVPDAARHPARPHPPQRRLLCACRHPVRAVPAAGAGLPQRPACPHGDTAHPDGGICRLSGGRLMGWLNEGIWLREGRFTLRRQKGVYLHCICVLHPDVCLRTFQCPGGTLSAHDADAGSARAGAA